MRDLLDRYKQLLNEQESTVTMFGCQVEASGAIGSAYAVTVDTSFCNLQNIMLSSMTGYEYPMYPSNSQIWAVGNNEYPNPWNVSNACEDGMSISNPNSPFGGSNWGANTSVGVGGPNFWFSNPTQAEDQCSNLAQIYSSGGITGSTTTNTGTTTTNTGTTTTATTTTNTGTTTTNDFTGCENLASWVLSELMGPNTNMTDQAVIDSFCGYCETQPDGLIGTSSNPAATEEACGCCVEDEPEIPEPGTGGMPGPGKPNLDKDPLGKYKKRPIKGKKLNEEIKRIKRLF